MTEASFGESLGWEHLSQQDREREYSPSSCVGYNLAPFLDAYAADSASSRRWCEANGFSLSTLRYGGKETQTTDVVTPHQDKAPLVAFIHGGYWQALSKRDGFGPAEAFVRQDCAYAAVDYTLAPAASIDEIVTECRSALADLHRRAPQLGVDPRRIVIAGSSAGAHLAAMVALDPESAWRPAGLVLLSGVFELEPLIGTSINEAIQLDVGHAHRNSPSRLAIHQPMPSVVAWGDNETDQFKKQSQLFAERLTQAGVPATVLEAQDRNHFDIVGDLGDPASQLGRAVAALIELTGDDHA